MFNIEFNNQPEKFLNKCDLTLQRRIIKKLKELAINPVLHDSKKIEGSKNIAFRIRVGDCRILYEIDYEKNEIGIFKIDKRSNVYK